MPADLRVVIAETLEKEGAEIVRGAVRQQFETEGAAFGSPWPPRVDGRGSLLRDPAFQALHQTGSLMRSLTERGAPYGSQEIRDGGLTLVISTEHPGAVPAQLGTRNEPARPIAPDALLDAIGEEIADKLGDAIVGALADSI